MLVMYFASACPSLKLVLQSISAHPLILILLLAVPTLAEVPALLAEVPTEALVAPRQMFRLTPAQARVMAATIIPVVPGAPSSAGWE